MAFSVLLITQRILPWWRFLQKFRVRFTEEKGENWQWSPRQEAHLVPMEECSPFKRRPAILKVFYLKSFAGGRRPTEQAVIGKGCSAYPDSLHAWCWLKPPFCLTTDWEHTINRATAWQEKWRELFSVASSARLNNEQTFFLSSPLHGFTPHCEDPVREECFCLFPFFFFSLSLPVPWSVTSFPRKPGQEQTVCAHHIQDLWEVN